MQLRYLTNACLYKVVRTKQSNGMYIDTYEYKGKYKVQEQELSDDVSASVYGADLYNIIRIKSVRRTLEKELKPKMISNSDNISKYIIVIDNVSYLIKSVKSFIDIKQQGEFNGNNSL